MSTLKQWWIVFLYTLIGSAIIIGIDLLRTGRIHSLLIARKIERPVKPQATLNPFRHYDSIVITENKFQGNISSGILFKDSLDQRIIITSPDPSLSMAADTFSVRVSPPKYIPFPLAGFEPLAFAEDIDIMEGPLHCHIDLTRKDSVIVDFGLLIIKYKGKTFIYRGTHKNK
jgi:hypothetical protein